MKTAFPVGSSHRYFDGVVAPHLHLPSPLTQDSGPEDEETALNHSSASFPLECTVPAFRLSCACWSSARPDYCAGNPRLLKNPTNCECTGLDPGCCRQIRRRRRVSSALGAKKGRGKSPIRFCALPRPPVLRACTCPTGTRRLRGTHVATPTSFLPAERKDFLLEVPHY